MYDKNSKLLVIGAGAIGGVCTGVLKDAGYEVEVVCKYTDMAEQIRTTGIKVTTPQRTFTVTVPRSPHMPS